MRSSSFAVIGPAGRAKGTAVTTKAGPRTSNRLLTLLPSADINLLAPSLKSVSLSQGVVLNEPCTEIEQVIFPHSGMVSLLAVMADGRAVETATVGAEGVVGGMAGFGLRMTITRAVVQTPLVASQIAAAPFRRAVSASPQLRDLLVRYNEALLGQVQVTAACNALHSIHARLARWILQTADRTQGSFVPLTQELISEMLGVRRSSVSEVAVKLQDAGLIRYSRGMIEIIDRPALMEAACECYETIRRQSGDVVI